MFIVKKHRKKFYYKLYFRLYIFIIIFIYKTIFNNFIRQRENYYYFKHNLKAYYTYSKYITENASTANPLSKTSLITLHNLVYSTFTHSQAPLVIAQYCLDTRDTLAICQWPEAVTRSLCCCRVSVQASFSTCIPGSTASSYPSVVV